MEEADKEGREPDQQADIVHWFHKTIFLFLERINASGRPPCYTSGPAGAPGAFRRFFAVPPDNIGRP